MEHAYDRTAGFDTHLHEMAREVFGPIDELAMQEVGFRFLDALRFADLYGQWRLDGVDVANDWLEKNYPPFDKRANRDARLQWYAGHMAWFAIMSAPQLELEINTRIASKLQLSETSLEALVRAMSTRIGTSAVRDLKSENPTRIRPILSLSSGEWIWFRPVDFVHEIFDWALSACSGSTKLRRAYDKRRQIVAEQLPVRLLKGVFEDRIYPNVSYPAAESDAELDALVALPGANLLIECKGGRFSPQGRRAAPLRVAKHAEELVTHAAD